MQSLGQLVELLLVSIALYLVPGYAVLRWLWPATLRPLSTAERFALALGVSLALPPLLLFAFRLVGLKWNTTATWVYVVLAAIALVAPTLSTFHPTFHQSIRELTRGLTHRARNAFTWDAAVLIALTFIAVIVRLYSVREFRAGLFGDSYHHTMIVQLLLDNGGLFDSWQPYALLASFTYHFGFHANVAFYQWLTGTPSTLSVLIIGQVLNAATVPLAFLLTSRVLSVAHTQSRLPVAAMAGLWAAVLTGFVNLMPAYFVNWGRYTQLAGQLLLPVVVVCWIELLERARESNVRSQARLIGLTALMTVSLMLTHYIVTIFAALIVGTYLLALVLREAKWRSAAQLIAPAAISAILALLIAAPWIRNTLGSGLARNTSQFISGSVDAGRVATYSALVPITPSYLKGWMIALGSVGLLLALARRNWRAALFAAWSTLIVLTVTPQTLGLPGAGVIDQLTGYVALYLTVLPLAGFALAAIHDWLACWPARFNAALARSSLHVGLLSAAMIGIAIWGATWLQSVPEPSQQMLTPADERAMTWIREHVPADTRFLVNTFPAYGGTLVAGTDGGWWIPLLTGRQTNLPPMNYGSERFEQADLYARTNGLTEALRRRPLPDSTPVQVDLTSPDNLQRLREVGIQYVYSGANATPGLASADWIDTAKLRASSAFRLLYDLDGVEIFEVVNRSG